MVKMPEDTVGLDEIKQRLEEARQLVTDGIAEDVEQARKIIYDLEQKHKRADLRIFYQDFHLVREVFPELMDEKPYFGSNVRMASVPSGSIDRALKYEGERKLALGKLTELVSKDRDITKLTAIKLTAIIDNFQFDEKKGIFLSSFSQKAVHKRGSKTFDEIHNLYRIEFKRVLDDYVFGMFGAWNRHEVSNKASLVLYCSESKVLEM